ncbi:MAG: hypothetical protein IPN38_07175 [Flavobacteriales bacterium]|nr:hypothetical protein [Flavobacteriales bacterium]
MKKVELSGSVRTENGSKGAIQLRREKRVPCVLYGGDRNLSFSLDEAPLEQARFHTPKCIASSWTSMARRSWRWSTTSSSTPPATACSTSTSSS